jgi:hypothetical protein
MYSKSLLIAIAAFAVTASGAQAFMGTNYAGRAGLSPTQTEAFGQARELRLKGRTDEARDVLLAAGIDEKAVTSLRHTTHAFHIAIKKAVEARDYEAFKLAVTDMPLSDIITSEEDFKVFVEAYTLRQSGQYAKATALYNDLGITRGLWAEPKFHTIKRDTLTELSPEALDALEVAKQANDTQTMRQILAEAGIEDMHKRGHRMMEQRY